MVGLDQMVPMRVTKSCRVRSTRMAPVAPISIKGTPAMTKVLVLPNPTPIKAATISRPTVNRHRMSTISRRTRASSMAVVNRRGSITERNARRAPRTLWMRMLGAIK